MLLLLKALMLKTNTPIVEIVFNDAYQSSYGARSYQIYLMVTHFPPLSQILAKQVTFIIGNLKFLSLMDFCVFLPIKPLQ